MAFDDTYAQRELLWTQAQTQADRARGRSYDKASKILHNLHEAYQLRGDVEEFTSRMARFIKHNGKRKALMTRLSDL